MKHFIYILASALLLVAVSCGRDEAETSVGSSGNGDLEVPEGWFVATFTAGADTRTPINGTDTRIQHLRYMVFDADDGSFVKERIIPIDQGGQQWPMTGDVVTDVLPNGNYRAVFLGNVDPSLFDFDAPFELLTGYTGGYSAARIHMPPVEFTANTEYYMATAEFSNRTPSSNIILQRIISRLDLSRNAIDTKEGEDYVLNMLVENIVANVIAGDVLQNTLEGLLSPLLGPILDPVIALAGPVDGLLDALLQGLLGPILEFLYGALLDELLQNAGALLLANGSDDAGLLEILTPVLNPWGAIDFTQVVVTINDFPRSVNFDREVVDIFADERQFLFSIPAGSLFDQKIISVKGFADPDGIYDIRKVNVLKQGLIGGVVIDGIVDNNFLLNDMLIDIDDPFSEAPGIENVSHGINEWYRADYSLVDLGLQNYDPVGDPVTNIEVNLGDILDLEDLTALLTTLPVVGDVVALLLGVLDLPPFHLGSAVLNTLLGDILEINISVPIQLPLVGIDNLSVSGSWSIVEQQ